MISHLHRDISPSSRHVPSFPVSVSDTVDSTVFFGLVSNKSTCLLFSPPFGINEDPVFASVSDVSRAFTLILTCHPVIHWRVLPFAESINCNLILLLVILLLVPSRFSHILTCVTSRSTTLSYTFGCCFVHTYMAAFSFPFLEPAPSFLWVSSFL